MEGNLFYSDVRDYILFKTVPDPDNPGKRISQNQNIGEVDMYGLELGVTARIFDPLRVVSTILGWNMRTIPTTMNCWTRPGTRFSPSSNTAP